MCRTLILAEFVKLPIEWRRVEWQRKGLCRRKSFREDALRRDGRSSEHSEFK
jgi:hypothetical protein